MFERLECRNFIWLPAEGSHRFASIVVLIGFAFLGVIGAPRAPDFLKLMGLIGEPGLQLAAVLLIAIFAHALLWLRAGSDYLTAIYAMVPLAVTHLVLGVLYTTIWSCSLLYSGKAELRLGTGHPIDWAYTMACISAGEGGLMLVFFVSAPFGRSTDKRVPELRNAKRSALRLLQGMGSGTKVEDLEPLLEKLETLKSASVSTDGLSQLERDLAAEWQDAASQLYTRLDGVLANTILTFRPAEKYQITRLGQCLR